MANPYDFTPQLKAKILEKIKSSMVSELVCPACGRQGHLDMADGFATIPLLWNVWTNNRKSGLPCAALVCTKCGHTMLFNLVALGFGESLGPDVEKIMEESRGR